MIYWDTSSAMKLYAAEPDSPAWVELSEAVSDDFACSSLMDAELAVSLVHKESRRELAEGGAKNLHELFRRHVAAGRFRLFPIGPDVFDRAILVARQCSLDPKPVVVRTLDCLHLATAMLLKCSSIATADVRMKKAAKILGLPVAAP